MPIYTRASLEARVNAGIKNKIGLLIDRDQTMNDAVRDVVSEVDLRSTRRKATLSPGIFDDVLAYPAPTDIKAQKLVSLSKQAGRGDTYSGFNLIPYEQFNARYAYRDRVYGADNLEVRWNERELYTVAFDDLSMLRRMLISAPQDGTSQVISSLDSLVAGGGLWTSFGDAFNVDTDTANYLRGSGSIGFDIDAAGGLTAGIFNATLTQFDISAFDGDEDSIFVFAYFSDATEITNITLRIGNDASNYYQYVVTATHFNTEFQPGWNVLRFDVSNQTTTGTVDATAMDYIALFMNKEATKISQSNFNFDHIVFRSGNKMDVRYYSKFPWQSQAGVWKENSTEDDDFLNLESDEYNMVLDKAIAYAGNEVDELQTSQIHEARYNQKLLAYLNANPSEALVETSDYQAQYYI